MKKITLDDLRKSTDAAASIKTIAQVLDADPRTVSKGVKEGTIPSIRVGRRVLVPREKFLALFEVNDD